MENFIFVIMAFENTIGQDNLKASLIQNIESGRTAHAQVFVGKDGFGSLAMAIDYAQHLLGFTGNFQKTINPLHHPDIHFFYPVIKNGTSASQRTSKDYLSEWRTFIGAGRYASLSDWYTQIDAGNKQGVINVEEAQEIIKTLSLKSYSGGYKVLIVWHAEKMNLACSNKLLKWIEEPNKNTAIILITEQADGLLKTIQSRCQTVNIPALKAQEIFKALLKKGADSMTAERISQSAAGNYDNALKLFEEDKKTAGYEPLFIEWVRSAFKAKSDKKSINRLMAWSERVSKLGREKEKQFLYYSLDFFRQAMLLNYGLKKMVHLKIQDASFSLEKFAFFIDGINIESIDKEIKSAIYHIERNGNGKIILTDLSIKLTRLLHKKKR